MSWGSYSPFFAPAKSEAFGYHGSMCSEISCPGSNALGHSIDCDVPCASPVARLLNGCRPSAIFRGVIAIVINAVNRLSWFCLTHIGKKGGRIIAPSHTDFNAAPTISGVFPVGFVVAPSKHVIPSDVFLSSGYAMGAPPIAKLLGSNTSTRATDAVSKMLRKNGAFGAAIAPAGPCGQFVARRAFGKNQPFPKALASQINKSRHFVTSIMVNNHCETRSNRVIEVPLLAAKPSYARGF